MMRAVTAAACCLAAAGFIQPAQVEPEPEPPPAVVIEPGCTAADIADLRYSLALTIEGLGLSLDQLERVELMLCALEPMAIVATCEPGAGECPERPPAFAHCPRAEP